MTPHHDHDDHHEPDLHDLPMNEPEEDLMPGPNFLALFRSPLTDTELDEIARALEQVIEEWLEETDTSNGDP